MRLGTLIAFGFGTILSFGAALAGIMVYSANPADGFYIIGHDELEHRAFAKILLTENDGNFFGNVFEGESLVGAGVWGNAVAIGLCEYLFSDARFYFALKFILHLIAARCLYVLIGKYKGEYLARYVTFFFLVYPPILLYSASYLKDDLVASLIVIAAFAVDRKSFLLLVLLIAFLAITRFNAVLVPIIIMAYLKEAKFKEIVVWSVIPVLGSLLIIPFGYFEKIWEIVDLPLLSLLFYVLKYLIGPIPSSTVLAIDSEVHTLFLWYFISFVGIILGFFFREFYQNIVRNWLWIVLLLMVTLGPYLLYVKEFDVVGPRQFSAVGWLFFLLFYERLFMRYKLKLVGSSRKSVGKNGIKITISGAWT